MFDFLIKFSGLLNSIFIPILFLISWKKNKFDLRLNTLSDCGSSKNSSKLFNFSLIFFGIFQTLFTFIIFNKYLMKKYILLSPPIFAGLFMFIDGVLDNKSFEKIHVPLGYIIFIILIPWSIIFHYNIILKDFVIGTIGLIISIVMSTGTIFLYLKYKKCAIPEICFVIGVFVWNLFFSYVIFFQ
jgi:hypothetical protein